MFDEPDLLDDVPAVQPRLTRRRARLVCAAAVASAVMSAALVIAAIALHPPVVAMPLIVVVCVGCPVFATWELPRAVAALRRSRGDARAIAALRRSLDRLPQVEHPLGH